MAEAFAIEMADLRKRYGSTEALRGLTLRVPRGAICGMLGRNGAGKTTTIKVLLGMARPDAGRAQVFGLSADEAQASVAIRRRTAFVSEDKHLCDYMDVDDIVRFTASFYPRWRHDLEARYRRLFALPGDRKVKALSRGTRTKLALLLALCRGAELLLLDEPTSGLDPAVSEDVLQAIVAHDAGDGTTVVFSSHQIAEVEQVADHIAIVHDGRAVVVGELESVRERYCRVRLVFDQEAPAPSFRAPGVVKVEHDRRVLTVLTSGGSAPVLEEARALSPVATDVHPVTLKEIFLETAGVEG